MVLKKFAKRHMKAEEVSIDTTVNEAIWAKGIKNPPHRIRVKMNRDNEGRVLVTLAEADKSEEEKKNE